MSLDLPKSQLVEPDNDGNMYGTREFMNFLKQVKDGINSPNIPHGTTAQRPIRYLTAGSTLYRDDTLKKVIVVDSLNPTVWRDTMGNIV